MRTDPVTACPGCGGRARSTITPAPELTVHRCRGCGLVYALERGDPDEIYSGGYLQGDNEGFGWDTGSDAVQALMAEICGRRMDRIEAVTGRGRLLDVGCGSGEQLQAAADRGWDVVGVEPGEVSSARARARGFDVRTTLLEDAGLPPDSFDVVTAMHVVEHVPDAPTLLRSLARWARPGGHVVVEVPNWASVERRRAGAAWTHLRPLEHVSHFTPTTLRATLGRAGLDVVRVRSVTYLWSRQGADTHLDALVGERWRRFERPVLAAAPLAAGTVKVMAAAEDRVGRGATVFAIAKVAAGANEEAR